jgi:Ca2+-binding RTX toxin-like protein
MIVPKNRHVLPVAAVSAALLVAGGAGLVFSAASASAEDLPALVNVGHGLSYEARPGQTNHLSVTRDIVDGPGEDTCQAYGCAWYQYRIDDSVAIEVESDPDNTCVRPTASDETLVVCTFLAFWGQDPGTITSFRLGDQNDVVKYVDLSGDHYEDDWFRLGAGKDTYTSTGGKTDANRIDGEAGNDTITTAPQIGDVARISGGDGNDTIHTSGEWTTAFGDAGNDKLYGGAGRQDFDGGTGKDLLRGGPGTDWLRGGSGNDTIYGDLGADNIFGNSGNDKLYGGKGTDTISGGPGRDVIKQD